MQGFASKQEIHKKYLYEFCSIDWLSTMDKHNFKPINGNIIYEKAEHVIETFILMQFSR